jgi:hypothetical protein
MVTAYITRIQIIHTDTFLEPRGRSVDQFVLNGEVKTAGRWVAEHIKWQLTADTDWLHQDYKVVCTWQNTSSVVDHKSSPSTPNSCRRFYHDAASRFPCTRNSQQVCSPLALSVTLAQHEVPKYDQWCKRLEDANSCRHAMVLMQPLKSAPGKSLPSSARYHHISAPS